MKPYVLECAYEIVHKVGGVETVVRTKAPEMIRNYGQNFLMCGPYIPSDERYQTFFEDQRANAPEFNQLLTQFENDFSFPVGCVKYGQWLIPGAPRCVLLPVDIDCDSFRKLREIAVDIINVQLSLNCYDFKDSTPELYRYNAISFGAMQWAFYSFFMPQFIQKQKEKCLVVQVHEWLAGFGLILMKQGNAYSRTGRTSAYWSPDKLRFVFTTHATTIGRHLSAGDICLNDLFKGQSQVDYADSESWKRGIALEHKSERAAANLAHVLTTVSTITGQECEYFLGRKPEVITWNGLHVNSQKGLVDDHELQSTHRSMKQKIMDFVQTYFCGIDPDNTQIFFTAGRNEYKNKGIDLFIDALERVRNSLDNDQFIREHPHANKTVVAFIIAPQPNHSFSQHALNTANLMKEMKLNIDSVGIQLQQNLIKKLCRANTDVKNLTLNDLLEKEDIINIKRFQQQLKKSACGSPITTHNLVDENCQIMNALRAKGLVNQPLTHVKVIFVPEFLSKTSIFGLDYQEFVRGAHLGVFASLYEPFGYTSPECMCVGTASVVSNMCGFGNLVDSTNQELQKAQKEGKKDVFQEMEQMHRSSSSLLDLNVMQNDVNHVVNSLNISTVKPHDTWIHNELGVQVIDRVHIGYNESVNQMYNGMMDYLQLSMYDRIALRNRMTRNAVFVDWSVQIKQFVDAYSRAMFAQSW
ncbi:Glycogen_synthase [Hexamita inflata]|uniref:Glycogen [starch] synthase n=1 Tax=Hexamita inflata TaxID=28002 RepID=A0AA86PL35_9EUKA|nr:Glycogen synthase [Hexamita inflata]